MKITRKHTVPAEVVEEVVWQCDVPGCDFESQDEEGLGKHFGQKHTIRAEAVILDDGRGDILNSKIQLRWFEFEDHAQKWLESRGDGDYFTARQVFWCGPGWYYESYDDEPCAKGCCSNPVVDLENIEGLICHHRDLARKSLEKADAIEAAVKALGEPCSDED